MPAYTGVVPTVEVIDPATVPTVPPLEIPGTVTLPLLGEVKTTYVAIAVAVLLVIVLFLLGFLIGRGHGGGGDDDYDDEPETPKRPQPPQLEERHTARVPRLVPREDDPAQERTAAPAESVKAPAPAKDTPKPAPVREREGADEPTPADEEQVRTMSLSDLLDDIHNM